MKWAITYLAFVASVSLMAVAQDQTAIIQTIQLKLRSEYVGHEFALRFPGLEPELKFDDSGAPIAKLTPAPITNGGVIRIDEVIFNGRSLRLRAHRVVLAYRTYLSSC